MSAALITILFAALASPSLAQQQKAPPPPPRPDSRAEFEKSKLERSERDARERDLKLAEKGAKEIDKNKQSITFNQASDDFQRLQTISNEIMMAVKKDDPSLNYLLIRDAAAEINKCAKRLKYNLEFPEGKNKKEKYDDSDDTDVKASFARLDALIKGFVTNRFLTAGVRDDGLGVKASSDLDGIIEMSNSIRKHSEKLSKSSQKP